MIVSRMENRHRGETPCASAICLRLAPLTAKGLFTPQIRCRFLRSRPPRRRPRYPSVGALVSSRRFPRTVCSLAVAIQLLMRFIYETGEGPMVSFVPQLCVPNTKPGAAPKSAGFISGGDMKQICADPFPHGSHTIYIIVRLLLPLAAGQLPVPPAPFPFLRQFSPRAPAGTG